MTEEDLDSRFRPALNLEASGREDREDWFEEGECPEMRQVEGPSASNCRRNGVNSVISVKGTTLDKN